MQKDIPAVPIIEAAKKSGAAVGKKTFVLRTNSQRKAHNKNLAVKEEELGIFD